MNDSQIKLLNDDFNLRLGIYEATQLKSWQELFVAYNAHTNLMSKNEIINLFEKHVYDSLAITKWSGFKPDLKILDIGTGGGFPSVILAICLPNLKIIANDSKSKKINFIKIVKQELKLGNLTAILGRAEDFERQNADIVTSRAVGKIKEVFEIGKKHIKQGGSFIIYKAKGVEEEIQEAMTLYKKLKSPEIIPYSLPTDVEHTRNLVIFKV